MLECYTYTCSIFMVLFLVLMHYMHLMYNQSDLIRFLIYPYSSRQNHSFLLKWTYIQQLYNNTKPYNTQQHQSYCTMVVLIHTFSHMYIHTYVITDIYRVYINYVIYVTIQTQIPWNINLGYSDDIKQCFNLGINLASPN